MNLKTVQNKIARITLVLLLIGTLFSPIVGEPVFAGDCPDNGSTSC